MPVQVSSGSQRSPEPVRQVVVLGATTSAGQVGLTPLQTSSGSHRSPEPVRQSVPVLPAGWAQLPAPSHTSLLHTEPSSVQGVPPGSAQLSAASLQLSLHSGPPAQGSP